MLIPRHFSATANSRSEGARWQCDMVCIAIEWRKTMHKVEEHLINCDADPYLRAGWKVEEHQKGGQFVWDESA